MPELPDGAQFWIQRHAAAGTWEGELNIPDLSDDDDAPVVPVFQAQAATVSALLAELEQCYRQWIQENEP